MPRQVAVIAALCTVAALAAVPAQAHNEGIPSVPLDKRNMEHIANVPSLSGNALDFFERVLDDGTRKRYAIAATQGNGFDILEITEPTHPKTVGRYVGPGTDPSKVTQYGYGANYHAWVSVNPRRNIVALTVEEPAGRTTRHNGGGGIQFVDISDVTNPKPLGKVDGLGGPHTVRMIGDNHAYTTLPTYVVDYTDPMNPKAQQRPQIEGHEFWEDANVPGRGYVGRATTTGNWGILDVRDPANPTITSSMPDLKITAAHEVFPAPDSSFVGIGDFKNGQYTFDCPGGGVHFYDVSGKYVPGASLENPKKMGAWFAPFTGASSDPTSTSPNYSSCTMHSWAMHPERVLALGGLYAGGTYVFDPTAPTRSDGAYTEFSGGTRGATTWGNTVGHIRDAVDYVNAAQFLPFDLSDPEHERLVFVNGWERGLDVYKYTGPLPKKLSRVRVAASTSAGAITGTLERYAVLTADGWKNLPLAGKTVEVTADGQTVEALTGDDGSFSAPLALGPGTHEVTVRWAGDDRFAENVASVTVSA